MSNPGAGTSREIATGDRADAELDAFVSRRDKQRRETEGERAVEDLWQARERLDNARRRRELEAPQEAPEDAETVEEAPDRSEPRPDAPGPPTAREGPQARPWWRRVFGG